MDHNAAPFGWDYSAAFDWMWKNKIFEESREEMIEWFEKEKQGILSDISRRLALCTNPVQRGVIELEKEDSYIRYICRKKYVMKHFNL